MDSSADRRTFLGTAAVALPCLALLPASADGLQQKKNNPDSYALPAELAAFNALSLVRGQAGDKSVTISALVKEKAEGFIEYGIESGKWVQKTKTLEFPAGQPVEITLDELKPNTRYFYRL